MSLIVHAVPGSPYARAVLATLQEKGAAYRLAPLTPEQMRSAEHLARHPFGRVPVLDHDGFVLYEAQAILRYLDRILPDPALTPAEVRLAARMDQVMNVNDWYLFNGVANVITFERIVKPHLLGLAPNEQAITAALPAARRVLAQLERLLNGQAYFCGASISLADLLVGPQIDMLSLTPEWTELVEPSPSLATWLQRIAERPSFQETTMEKVTAMAKAAIDTQ